MLVLLCALEPAPHPPCVQREMQRLHPAVSARQEQGTVGLFTHRHRLTGWATAFSKKNFFCSRSHSLSKPLCLHSPLSSMSNFCSVCCIQNLILLLESDITCFTSHRVLAVGYIAGSGSPYIVCSSSSGANFFQFNTQQMCSQSFWSCF